MLETVFGVILAIGSVALGCFLMSCAVRVFHDASKEWNGDRALSVFLALAATVEFVIGLVFGVFGSAVILAAISEVQSA